MNEIQTILKNRTVSSFPLSIGTGLTLESMFFPTIARYDDKREIPITLNPDDYAIHYFNIFTLARNIVNACSYKEKVKIYTSKYLIETLEEEIQNIEYLYSNTTCEPVIFIPDYKDVYLKFNLNKGDKLPRAYEEYMYVFNMLKKLDLNIDLKVVAGDIKLPKNNKKVLITTSYIVDLLNISRINNLYLLESHTGKLKKQSDWYSKYHKIGKRDMSVFPFDKDILFILGDKTFIKPLKLTFRVMLHDYAVICKWTSFTNSIKVGSDLFRHETLKDELREFRYKTIL